MAEKSINHGSTEAHQNLVKDFSNGACKEFDDIVVLPYTNGMFRAFDNPDRIIRTGVTGVVDILVIGPGFYIWFDAKTGKARFTKEQLAFKNRLYQINKRDTVFKLPSVEVGLRILRQEYEQRKAI